MAVKEMYVRPYLARGVFKGGGIAANKKKSKYRGFLVDRLDDKFLVIKGDVSNFTPWKANLWSHPGVL